MKLLALKALIAAVEHGSLRSAARHMKFSQPALSKMIRELEIELGTTLLTRTTLGVVPTPPGQILYERSKKVAKELGSAVDEINQLSGHMRGDLSIGAVPLAVMLLIPETLRTFAREFPDINLRISEELYFEQLERLRRGDVQVAVGGIPRGLANGDFVIESLIETTMVVVVRKGSPLQKAKSLVNLADAKWVYTGNSKDEGYAKTLYEMHDLPAPHVGALVNSTLALLSLVSTGDFVGLMPVQLAHSPIASQFISIVPIKEKELHLTVGAIVRSDMVVSPAVKAFIKHLHRAAHQISKQAYK